MKMRMHMAMAAACLLMAIDATAQERRISVSSNVDSAAVFIDDAWAGRVSDGPFMAAPNASVLTVRLPWLSAWSVEPL